MPDQPTKVIAVVATYCRPQTLAPLLQSLAAPDNQVAKVIVVDNANDPATEECVRQSPVCAERIVPPTNLSCGGGVKRGLQAALMDAEATHFWLLDDDARAFPGALAALQVGLTEAGADVAVPSVLDERGKVSWCAGLLEPGPNRLLQRHRITPQEYLQQFGPRPVPFSWAPWPSILVTRRAIETVGFPRDDFWLMGEDLEFTLRLTARFRGVYVPVAHCGHYPPDAAINAETSHRKHRIKFGSMLQNMSYSAFHLRHCRRILRHLPGNYLRFLRTFGINAGTLADVGKAFWRGAIRGKPGATPGFNEFQQRWAALGRAG